jgi:hypothetical protein
MRKTYLKYIVAALMAAFLPTAFGYDASLPVSDSNPPPTVNYNGVATYRVQVADITPAATATDVLMVCGSATKTVYVHRVQLTADATGAAVIDFYLYKRTTANTGGTSTAQTLVKMNTADAAATATAVLYTANPATLGTGALINGDHYEIPATTGTAYYSPPWVEDFGTRGTEPVVLHGTSECLSMSLNGQTLPAGFSLYAMFEISER